MVFHAGFRGGEVAELLSFEVIIMDAVGKTAVEPVPVCFDAEEVEACLGEAAAAPATFQCHLGEDDGSRDAVLLLLAHGCMGISLEEVIRGKEGVLADMEGPNTLQLYISYIDKEVVGVFEFSS